MSVLKHLKTLQHVSIFSDHLQGVRRFLAKVTEFKSFYKLFKILKVICGDAAAKRLVCARGVLCGEVLQSSIPLHTERHAHTPNVMQPHHHK